MRRILEDILEGQLILAIEVTLLDVVILVGDPRDTDALGVAFLVDYEATEVVLAIWPRAQREEVESALGARAEELEDQLGELH